MPERAADERVRVTLGDHARVAWLLLCTLAGVVPFLLFVPLSPLLRPLLRARVRRRLQDEPVDLAEPPVFDATACAGATVFVVAGEPSGDALAARVIRRAREQCPDLHVRGYGGPALSAAGAQLDRDIVSQAVVGFVAVIGTLGTWWRLCAETIARFRDDPPDVLLTVDFPGLNVRLAGWARARGVHTVHLVAPKVWAHTPWRIHRWRRGVDVILATFPFEPLLFADSGIRTVFVGHPLFEAPLTPPRTDDAPPAGEAIVELWPGSRKREIASHAGPMMEAAEQVERALPGTRFVLRLAHAKHEAWFRRYAQRARWSPSGYAVAIGPAQHDAPLRGALAASGTATAELAVDLVPLTVFYRVGLFEWILAHIFVTAPWISIANLVLGRTLLTERVCWRPDAGEDIGADFLAAAGTPEAWTSLRAGLREVRERLETPHVATRAAGWLLAETAAQRKGAVAAPGQAASPAGGPA